MTDTVGAKAPAAGRRTYRVPASQVVGNEWPSLRVETLDSLTPRYLVSVVVPYYQAPKELERTLAGLERQTYPRSLFEVIVVDDGSAPPLKHPTTTLDLRVEYQEDMGYRLALARNAGARAARGDILLFLDCDMIPEDDWMAAHARWHHAARDALTLGFRFHVDADDIAATMVQDRNGTLGELFSGREITRPEWIEDHMERTADLTSDDDDLFRAVTGGNFGISKELFEEVGGFDETFTQWGAEDREFAYRAYSRGALLVPERAAVAWHQGEGAVISASERASLRLQFAKMSHLVAHSAYRSSNPGRSFTVPKHVITLRTAGAAEETIWSTATQVLSSDTHDLALLVEEGATEGSLDWVRRQLHPDPRVFFGPPGTAIERFPVSPFHIVMDSGTSCEAGMVARLRDALGPAAFGRAHFRNGSPVTIYRARAWHRANRAGKSLSDIGPAIEFTHENSVPGHPDGPEATTADGLTQVKGRLDVQKNRLDAHDARLRAHDERNAERWRQLNSRLKRHEVQTAHRFDRVERQIGQVEQLLSDSLTVRARRLVVAMLARPVRMLRKLRRTGRPDLPQQDGPTRPPPASADAPPPSDPPKRSDPEPASYTLGADIVAIGPRAEAVFAASKRVRNTMTGDLGAPGFPLWTGRHLDLLIVDSPVVLHGLDEPPPEKTRVLELEVSDAMLSVPAFDPEQINPIGWHPDSSQEVCVLGAASRFGDGEGPADGSRRSDPISLRGFHHVVVPGRPGEHPADHAARLAMLAASGTVVYVQEPDPRLRDYLGQALYDLIRDPGVASADTLSREARSIATRREALRTHSLRRRAEQALAAGGAEGLRLPEVSVLLPTRRPDQLGAAVRSVAAQTYPRLELVVGLHGDGFGDKTISEALAGIPCPVQVVRIDSRQNLGEMLNAISSASDGTLLAKMDDDDHYSAEHVWDLVLAHEFSRAQLVAKASEFVYLQSMDMTVRLRDRLGERYFEERSVSGGVMLISRSDLAAAGGWRRMPRQIDLALAEDVLLSGGKIYLTHGSGYIRVRHGSEHTWTIDSDFFTARAADYREGLDLEFAGL